MKLLIALLALLTLSACSSLTVEQQHMIAKRNHHYISDQQQYGADEVWTASLVGDCEDFALWMKQRVGGELVYVRTKQGEPHIVLVVDAVVVDGKVVGGKVVDNQASKVYPVSAMTHKQVYVLNDRHLSNYLNNKTIPAR